jgi:hypothetical protein
MILSLKNSLTYGVWQFLLIGVLLGATGCDNLQKDIDVVLPVAPAQLVVECYLEPNQRPKCRKTWL